MLRTHEDPEDSQALAQGHRARALAGTLRDEFGAAFAIYDATTGDPLLVSDPVATVGSPLLDPSAVLELAAGGRPRVVDRPGGGYQLGLVVREPETPDLVAVGVVEGLARSASEAALERGRLAKWL